MKKAETVRKTITISKEIDEYYRELAKTLGASQSAVIAMALYNQIHQDKTISAISDFEKLVSRLGLDQ